jgi:hypothetical protein
MKKHLDAVELAAMITAAASQPPAILYAPEPTSGVPVVTLDAARDKQQPETERKQKESRQPDVDTVPISLRPHRALLNRYIMAAAERTREEGRVISAQQIMLEVLERTSV